MSPADPRRILVRCPNWVGDVVMATPTLRALRERFPEARLDLLLRGYVAPLIAGGPLADEILVVDAGGGPGGVWRTARRLRGRGYDAALLLTNSMTTGLEAFLARIPRRIGYRGDGRSPLLTEALPRGPRTRFGYRRPEPMVDSYLRLAGRLGADPGRRPYELHVSAAQEAWGRAFFRRHGLEGRRLVGVNPGARFGSSKLWMPERFAAAADEICRRRDAVALLLGGPGEEELLARIAAAMKGPRVDTGRDLVPLGELKAVVRRLDLLLTTDTGTRAIAQAFGVPTVVVMGATHPGWTDAQNERARVLRHEVPCGPCHLKICPVEGHPCMAALEVEEVVEAGLGLFEGSD